MCVQKTQKVGKYIKRKIIIPHMYNKNCSEKRQQSQRAMKNENE